MTIDEAIRNLRDQRAFHLLRGEKEAVRADQMGLEALKVFSELSPMFRVGPFGLLPGETEE